VSFGPDLRQRYAWIHGHAPNPKFKTAEEAIRTILSASPEASVNTRSFQPDNPKSRKGLDSAAVRHSARELGDEGDMKE